MDGVRFVILNREQFNSVRLGLELARALQTLYPGKIDFEACRLLIGNRAVLETMKTAGDAQSMVEDHARAFLDRRRPFLLY